MHATVLEVSKHPRSINSESSALKMPQSEIRKVTVWLRQQALIMHASALCRQTAVGYKWLAEVNRSDSDRARRGLGHRRQSTSRRAYWWSSGGLRSSCARSHKAKQQLDFVGNGPKSSYRDQCPLVKAWASLFFSWYQLTLSTIVGRALFLSKALESNTAVILLYIA